MGAGLGLALSEWGHQVTHLVRSDRPAPEGAGLSVGAPAWRDALAVASVVLIATPDAAITATAGSLRGLGVIGAPHVVLHLSGLHDRTALAPLRETGAALGSLHPLQAIADPRTAPARLRGAFAGIEGDDRALEWGGRLAREAGMTPVHLPPGSKPGYHAAAAMTSNLTVALYALASRVAAGAGVPAHEVERMYLGLLRGTVENLEAGGAAAALTGAIRRGDADTVTAHLAALGPDDREIYRRLGLEALRLAEIAGLAPQSVATIRRRLEDDR